MNTSQNRSSRSRTNIWSNGDGGHFTSSSHRNRTPSPAFIKRKSAPRSVVYQDDDEPSEWICIKCSIKNYNRRETCFKCGVTRMESQSLDAKGYAMVGIVPNDTLLIRELPSTATADAVGQALMKSSGVPIQRVKMSESRRYAFVQLESVENATEMLKFFQKVIPYIDNCAVIASYSKHSFDELFSEQQDITRGTIPNQYNLIPVTSNQPSSATIMTPFGQLQIYDSPDSKSFKLEPSSGYFFDAKTGFYYDPKSDYYYNPNTNQWMFWCSKFSTYINCEGDDLEMKKQFQEEERDYQFRKKYQQEKGEVEGQDRKIRLDVRPSNESHQTTREKINRSEGNKVQSGNGSNTMEANLIAMLQQNDEMVATFRDDLAMVRDQHSVAKIHNQIETLRKQRETLQTSLASLRKQQMTKNIAKPPNLIGHERPPYVVELIDDDPNDGSHVSKNALKDLGSWRRTAFDDHIEQAEQLRLIRKEEEKRAERIMLNDAGRVFGATGTGIEAKIRQMVQEEWRQQSNSNREKKRRSSTSVERDDRGGRSRRRHRSSRSRSQSLSPRRERTRSHTRRDQRRTNDKRRSTSPISRGQEPMTISPQPSSVHKSTNENWIDGRELWASQRREQGMSLGMGIQQRGSQFVPMGAPANVMFGSSTAAVGPLQPMQMLSTSNPSQFIGIGQTPIMPSSALSISGSMPMGIATPGMPTMSLTQQKQFFPSNEDHWRLAARLQQERLSMSGSHSIGQFHSGAINEVLPGALSQSTLLTPSSSSQSTQLCTNCSCFGHSRINCPMEKNKQSRDIEFIGVENTRNQKKMEVVEKERNKLLNLNICFNCGRPGHNQFGCRHPRISDDELQRKIRRSEENSRRKEMDKERLKRKAERYPVRRKDVFIERLREVAPRGKITKELVRSVCSRCSSLNHNSNECRNREIARSIHKKVCQALKEFIRVFFVHLNEDNLVDFSQKFDTFSVMDAIERGGTIDPVGLQLQSMCKDGIVTQGDLRELCSKCANLGHKQQDCKDKDGCSRTHYEKMLTLVKGYRALVKEGNGNFLLPNALQKHFLASTAMLKQIQSAQIVPIEEIMLLESSEDDEEKNKNEKDGNNGKKEGQSSKKSEKSNKKQAEEEPAERNNNGEDGSNNVNKDKDGDDDIEIL